MKIRIKYQQWIPLHPMQNDITGRSKLELRTFGGKKSVKTFLRALTIVSSLGMSVMIEAHPILITHIPIPSGLGSIAVNSELNKIYLSGQGAQPLEVDGRTFSQVNVGTPGGDAVDVDSTNNDFWEAGLYSGTVTVWSGNTTQATTIPLGDCPTGVNVDAPHRRAWVSAQCGGGNDPVWAVDADTFTVTAGPIGSGGVQGPTQVNPATDRFYISPSGVSKRVDPFTFTVTLNVFGTVLGANASANLLYAVTNNNTLQIINGAPDPEVVETNITLPFFFGSSIGVNPKINRIYIGSSNSNLVAVLNAKDGRLIQTIALGEGITSVGSVAVDPRRDRAYVVANAGDSAYLYIIKELSPDYDQSDPDESNSHRDQHDDQRDIKIY